MAEKNWLIRTKNNQILGPATKQKVIELIQKGSLTGEDEICCGNGYWFWIKEEDLLEKYVYGDISQGFNPISEAPDVLTAGGRQTPLEPFMGSAPKANQSSPQKKQAPPSNEEEMIFPNSEDLEYPDMGVSSETSSNMELEQVETQSPSHIEAAHESNESEESNEEDITRLDLSDLSGQINEMKAAGQGKLREDSPSALNDSEEEIELLPSDDDLEYPDLDDVGTGEIDLNIGEEDQSDDTHPLSEHEDRGLGPAVALEQDDLENEGVKGNSKGSLSKDLPELSLPPKAAAHAKAHKKKKPLKRRSHSFSVDQDSLDHDETSDDFLDGEELLHEQAQANGQVKQRNDKYLFFILILVFVLIAVLFYYYRTILNKPLPFVGIASVQAQGLTTLGKKKTFYS